MLTTETTASGTSRSGDKLDITWAIDETSTLLETAFFQTPDNEGAYEVDYLTTSTSPAANLLKKRTHKQAYGSPRAATTRSDAKERIDSKENMAEKKAKFNHETKQHEMAPLTIDQTTQGYPTTLQGQYEPCQGRI